MPRAGGRRARHEMGSPRRTPSAPAPLASTMPSSGRTHCAACDFQQKSASSKLPTTANVKAVSRCGTQSITWKARAANHPKSRSSGIGEVLPALRRAQRERIGDEPDRARQHEEPEKGTEGAMVGLAQRVLRREPGQGARPRRSPRARPATARAGSPRRRVGTRGPSRWPRVRRWSQGTRGVSRGPRVERARRRTGWIAAATAARQ